MDRLGDMGSGWGVVGELGDYSAERALDQH